MISLFPKIRNPFAIICIKKADSIIWNDRISFFSFILLLAIR